MVPGSQCSLNSRFHRIAVLVPNAPGRSQVGSSLGCDGQFTSWFLYLLLAIVGVTEFQQFTPTSYQDNCSNISVSFWTITVGKLASFWIGVILWVLYACLLGFTFFCKLLWWQLTLFPKQVSPVGSPKSQFESTVEKFSSLSVITNISFALIWSCLPLWSYPGLSSGSQITKLSQGLRSLGAVCINNTHGIVPVLWTPLLIC